MVGTTALGGVRGPFMASYDLSGCVALVLKRLGTAARTAGQDRVTTIDRTMAALSAEKRARTGQKAESKSWRLDLADGPAWLAREQLKGAGPHYLRVRNRGAAPPLTERGRSPQ